MSGARRVSPSLLLSLIVLSGRSSGQRSFTSYWDYDLLICSFTRWSNTRRVLKAVWCPVLNSLSLRALAQTGNSMSNLEIEDFGGIFQKSWARAGEAWIGRGFGGWGRGQIGHQRQLRIKTTCQLCERYYTSHETHSHRQSQVNCIFFRDLYNVTAHTHFVTMHCNVTDLSQTFLVYLLSLAAQSSR